MTREISIELDRTRKICFNAVSEDKIAQLEVPPTYGDITSKNPFKSRRAIAVFILMSLTENHEFSSAADILELLPPNSDKMRAASKAILETVFAYLDIGDAAKG